MVNYIIFSIIIIVCCGFYFIDAVLTNLSIVNSNWLWSTSGFIPAGCINYCLLVDFKYLVSNAYIVTHKKRFLSECFVFLKLTAGMLLSVVFK